MTHQCDCDTEHPMEPVINAQEGRFVCWLCRTCGRTEEPDPTQEADRDIRYLHAD